MLGLAHRGFELKDYTKHLAQYLGKNGYETALFGIQHEASESRVNELGYEKVHRGEGKDSVEKDLDNAAKAAAYIREKKDKPFFLSFGMINTHREFPELNDEINPNYVIPPLPLYDNAQNREDMARYMLSVQVVDQGFGIVWDALKETGLDEETILFFTTDHGLAFPKMKCNVYDTGMGVSLIMNYPGNPAKGKAVDALVSHIDLFPTLCELNELPQPQWLEGQSMVPLFNGDKAQIRDEVFSEVSFHAAYEPKRCIRTERYKYIRWYDDHDQQVLANIDESLSKDFLMQHGFEHVKKEREMLFDLYLDPVERVNLIGREEYKAISENLASRLDAWMHQTNDPILKGKIIKPEGAKINRLECINPQEEDFE